MLILAVEKATVEVGPIRDIKAKNIAEDCQ